jgi:extracellular elastinolytic metalloproteinase
MRLKRRTLVAALAVPLSAALTLPAYAASASAETSTSSSAAVAAAAPDDRPRDVIAIEFVRAHAADYGLTADDVADLRVSSMYTSKHNKVTHVNLRQYRAPRGEETGPVALNGVVATVNIREDGSVLFVGENLAANINATPGGTLQLSAAEAIKAAADGLGLDDPEGLRTLKRASGAERATVFSDGDISEAPIPANLTYAVTDDGVRLAWEVVIDEVDEEHQWQALVDAETGDLLEKNDWTAHDHIDDLQSTFARADSGDVSAAAAPPLVTDKPVNDGSSYLVTPFPYESPNDGPQTVINNPADSDASPFGWHDTDGILGPEYTITRGNNVHAFTDRDATNVADVGSSPDGGAGLDFLTPFNFAEHPQNSTDAAVTNLFYANNMIHDLLHGYGFDEEAGNFQENNYGRGGTGGDFVRAEAQDGNGFNNANFNTPAQDGMPPRMQMFLWNPNAAVEPNAALRLPMALTITSGAAAGTHLAQFARFGPTPTNAGVSGNLVLVNDATPTPAGGTVNDGCEPFQGFPAGSIALVDRAFDAPNSGGNNPPPICSYLQQVQNAQAAGAIAVVVANNVAGAPATMNTPGAQDENAPTIPAIMINQASGDAIKAAGTPVSARVHHNDALAPMRDGDLENGIIAHEYGHGVSNRLTGGLNINCLSGQEQMGEGWSDFLGVSLLADAETDDPYNPRGMGPYALYQANRQGAGIRVTPYSRNMNINPFTYDNIKTGGWRGGTIATPHGIGWAWNTVLWDLHWDLVDVHGFNPNKYQPWNTGGNNLAIQLVMDGMKMQGCGPGFVAGRDGIIAADAALTGDATTVDTDGRAMGENYCTIWNAFARRGLGLSAVQGTTDRNDNTQAFDVPAVCDFPVTGVDPRGTYGDSDTLNVCWDVAAGRTVTAVIDNRMPFTPCQPLELWTLPLGFHSIIVTERDAEGDVTRTRSITFSTTTSFDDMNELIDRFSSRNQITPAVAESLRYVLSRAEALVRAGRNDPPIERLMQFIERAENQIKGNMDQAAKAALIRDAQYLITEIQADRLGDI